MAAESGASGSAVIEGPAWAQQGLDQREGRYPLAVEAPVLSMVATLLPGLSTLTQFARYYGLYWAIADMAEQRQLDASACRRLVRRAEVVFAFISSQDAADGTPKAHGVDALERGLGVGRSLWEMAEEGNGSYSPRPWGFWSQYGGPSDVLGTVATDAGALRAGRHRCPPDVRALYAPLLATAESDRLPPDTAAALGPLALDRGDTADMGHLRELFTGTRGATHAPSAWTSPDRVRRSSMRVLARSAVLEPTSKAWHETLLRAVAHGGALEDDPILASEAEAGAAWRGLLLRHHSVGAWRRLWASLVGRVRDVQLATRKDLHDWIAGRLPDQTVAQTLDDLPPTADSAGHLAGAEEVLDGALDGSHRDIAILMLGARRRDELTGASLIAFLGGRSPGRGTFLDPTWVARQIADHRQRSMRDLGRALVDDMLAQSRRVALRKIQVRDGRLQMFSRLHERNDTFTARTAEGAGNVGLRIEQVSGIGEQLGLLSTEHGSPTVTPLGASLLDVPT